MGKKKAEPKAPPKTSPKASPKPPEPVIATELPAIFQQAHLGFCLRRNDWPAHAHITGNGDGAFVDWQGKSYLLSAEDVAADWSVK